MSDNATRVVSEQRAELRNKAIFNHRKYIWGIPQRPFVASMALTVFAGIVLFAYLPKIIAVPCVVVLAMLILIPVYLVHKNDPDAYVVWMYALFASERRITHRVVRREIVVLSESPNGLSARSLTSEMNP